MYTVEPPNKGHLGTQAGVPYSEVVLYSEVFGKIVFLHSIHVYNISRVFHSLAEPDPLSLREGLAPRD